MNKNLRTISALVLVLLTMGSIWFGNRAVIPKKATWQDVLQEAKTGGYGLIEVDELQARYQDPSKDLLLVDTRQEWEYRSGYIKNALNFSFEPTWWYRLTKKSDLASFLGADKSKFLVFY